MAHYEKYDKDSIAKQFNHDNRKNTDKKDRIDKTRSYLNYNLCDVEDPIKQNKELIEMIKKQGGRIRKDSVYMCSLIITLPKDFPDSEELEKQFFKSAKRHLDKIHGKDNCLSAWVHRDEAQPHMHYRFCPIKYDKEKNKYKLCAKEILNRNFLKSFHKDLEKEMEEELGFKVSILNGATKDGHKEIEELIEITEKKEEIEKEIKKLDKILMEKKKEANKIPDYNERSRRYILNEFWNEYKEISKSYWYEYSNTKRILKDKIWETKRGIAGNKKQIEKDLDFISNLSQGLLYALFKLIGALILYRNEIALEKDLKALESDFKALETARRSISNYQHNAKETLLKCDLDNIENKLQKWEDAVININAKIRDNMIIRETEIENEIDIEL